MQHYVLLDENGVILDLFNEESLERPESAVAIDESLVATLRHCSTFSKYRYVDEQLVEVLTLADFKKAHDTHINAPALARNYDSFATFALRAMRPGPWQAEGIIFYDWMEACNSLGYQIIAEVQSGQRPIPASIEAYLALLPPLNLPEV